jgi:hypothetical protein
MTNPTLPRSKLNPTQTTKIERRTNAVIQFKFDQYWKGLSRVIQSLKYKVIEVSGFGINAQFYAYQLDKLSLEDLDAEMKRLLERYLLAPNKRTKQHFMEQAASMGYESGEIEALLNFDNMTDGAYPRKVEFVLRSQPYADRIAYVKSRALEDFKGFTGIMTTDLRRLLVDGMANGDNPNVIARKIRAQILGDKDRRGAAVRAKLIARTEITGAHRRALWDEDKRANDEGIKTKLLHVSALIVGRTRLTHAKKHGFLWPSRKALQDWYQVEGNGINCLCTQSSAMVDENGNILSKKLAKKMIENKDKYVALTAKQSKVKK